MNAEQARQIADRKRAKKRRNPVGIIGKKIQTKAESGKSSHIAFTTLETREGLKLEGYRVYSILSITLIRW